MKRKRLLSLLLAFMLVFGVASVMPASVSAKQKVEYRSARKEYKSNGVVYVKLSVKIPKLTEGTAAAKKINAYFTKLKNTCKKEAKKLVSAAKSDYKDNPQYFRSYVVKLSTKFLDEKDGKISFKVLTGTFTNGAHGLSVTDGAVFDTATGKKLLPSQMTKLSPKALKSKIIKATNKAIDKNPKTFFPDAKNTVKQTALNKFKCALKGDYFYVFYNSYEIAPYASGLIKVKFKL